MATIRWTGLAPNVQQVDTIQITAYDAATTYTVTIGNVAVSVVGTTDANGTASALNTALGLSGHAYFSAVTWTVSTDTVTGTGVNGEPFILTASVAGGTGTVSHTAEATAAESANHFTVAENWSSNTVPTTNDEIIFDKGSTPLLWDIDQNALSLNLVRTDRAYTGYIGLNPHAFMSNGTEATSTPEYRETHFKIDADRIEIGRESGNQTGAGQGRVNIDNGDAGTPVCIVFNTAASARDTGQLAVDYVANDAAAVLTVINAPGGVGVAVKLPGTTAVLASIDVQGSNAANRVVVGEGTTVTNYRQNSGVNILACAADLAGWIRVNGGTLTTLGEEWTAATVDIYGGRVNMDHYDSTTLATTTNVWNGATLDLSRNSRTRTISTVKLFPECVLITDPGFVTITTMSWENESLKITTEKP